jgi:hypothetical protein
MYRFFYRRQEKEVKPISTAAEESMKHNIPISYVLSVCIWHTCGNNCWGLSRLQILLGYTTSELNPSIICQVNVWLQWINDLVGDQKMSSCPSPRRLQGENSKRSSWQVCLASILIGSCKNKICFYSLGSGSKVILVKDNQINGTTHVQNIHFILYTLHAGHTILHWMMNFLCQLHNSPYIVWINYWCGCWLRSTWVSSYKWLLVCKHVCITWRLDVTFN